MTPLSTRIFGGVVWRVVDGDTVDVLCDLDVFEVWLMRRFRLLGCNARETHEPGGKEAKANLAALLPVGTHIGVTSVRMDKFGGRYDAHITLPDGGDLIDLLIEQQWAAPWNATGERPLPPWPRPG